MKNIYINIKEAGREIQPSSFPEFFRIDQFVDKDQKNYKLNYGKGTIGDSKLPYQINARHNYINLANETANMSWLISIGNIYEGNIESYITRKEIEKKFYILDFPDYSHQSESTFYIDFIPLVFRDGKKIQQKYVATIKDFTSKRAYLLLDKSSINIEVANELKVIIAFKDIWKEENSLQLNKYDEDGKIFKLINKNTKMAFQNKNISDYYIKSLNKFINPAMIKSFIVDYGDDEKLIKKQDGYFELVTKKINNKLEEDDLNKKPNKISITVEFYQPITSDYILLYSRNNSEEVVYNYQNDNFIHEFNTDVWTFNLEGVKTQTNINEIIPRYNDKRIIIFTANSNNTIKYLLNSQTDPIIYRWNLKNPEMIYFRNGLFKGDCTYSTTVEVGDEIIIYDNQEELDDNLIDKTITGNEISNIKIKEKEYNYSYDGCTRIASFNKFQAFFNENKPFLSFYVMSKNNESYIDKLRIMALLKYYPVFYEAYQVDPYTMYFRLPKHIANNLNQEIYNSIETELYAENRNNINESESTLYVLNTEEITVPDETYLKNKLCICETYNGCINKIITSVDYDESKTLELQSDGTYKYDNDVIPNIKTSLPRIYTISYDDETIDTDMFVAEGNSSAELRYEVIDNVKYIAIREKTFNNFKLNQLINQDDPIEYDESKTYTIGTKYIGTYKATERQTIQVAELAIINRK